MTIIADQQKFDVGDVIELFDLDLTPISAGHSVIYFTPTIYTSSAYVKWRGNEYQAVDVQATGFERSTSGALPRPKLSMSGAVLQSSFLMSTINAELIAHDNLRGARVVRWRTLKTYIDNETTADVNMYIQVDVYVINQKTLHNKYNIEWELVAYVDYEGQKLPRRQMLKDFCTHVYRTWNSGTSAFEYNLAGKGSTCPYAGASTAWQASTAYTTGTWVIPTTPNGYRYYCTVAGTSHDTEPGVGGHTAWPTTEGTSLTESGSTVTWKCYHQYYKEDGTGTTTASEDVCGKRTDDCLLRYPYAALPTTAFPLISATRVR